MDETSLLDLLDAMTEVRVRHPELRPAVLASMRLAISENLLAAGRLYHLRHDGEVLAIISQGESTLGEENDQSLIQEAQEGREPVIRGPVIAYPLGKEERLYGILILEHSQGQTGDFLADLFLQWSAVAEHLNLEKAELVDENFQLREQVKIQFSDRNIIGVSGNFRHVVEGARRVASSNATVLINGETGTGKELVARLIHDHSPRANAPFITVNCGALTESLLETELFGHIKGAFTGAVSDRKGKFEAAHGGSIFLDEIGEISPTMQVRLLRVLQEMEVVRVGDHKTRKLDVRVIAATNRDLEEEMREGRFRADLFYRLNVVHLNLPPLRARKQDIPLLAEHFLSIYCQRNCKYIDAVNRDVLEILGEYPWPGNIRELENCIEKMVVMAPGRELTTDMLPMAVMAYHSPEGHVPLIETGDPMATQPSSAPLGRGPGFEQQLKRYMQGEMAKMADTGDADLYDRVRSKWERHLFEVVLDNCRNNKSKAARILGITRNTLNARLGSLSTVTREWTVD